MPQRGRHPARSRLAGRASETWPPLHGVVNASARGTGPSLGIAAADLAMLVRTAFEGMPVGGAVRRTIVRGEDVVRDGKFVGRRGYGRFQPRALS